MVWVGVGVLGGNTVGGADDVWEGGKLLLAAPLTGMGRVMREVGLWRAGWVSLEAWEKVWEWFGGLGDGESAGNLAGNASRGPGL